jgi:hypothetical protein
LKHYEPIEVRPIPVEDIQEEAVFVFEVTVDAGFGGMYFGGEFFEGEVFVAEGVNEVDGVLYYFASEFTAFGVA